MKSHLLTILCFFTLVFGLNAQVTSVGLIGSATPGGWDNETPMTKLTDSTWTLDITLVNGFCKFRANNSWDLSWGDTTFPKGIGSTEPGGENNVPVFGGDYTVTFNSNSGEYYFDVDSDIGIIGDATPGGWDNDTDMYIDPTDTNQYYIVLNLTNKSAKFRQDDSWAVNWGATAFPEGVAVLGSPDNIPISNAGKYRVDFNKATGAYKFSEEVDFRSIGMIGDATPTGWDNETPMTKDASNPDLWNIIITLKEGQFKFRGDSTWAKNWGEGSFPNGVGVFNSANNIVVSAENAGEYQGTFNTKTAEYNFVERIDYPTLGIIGSATPGGNNTATPMVKDPNDKTKWSLRIKLVNGDLRFIPENNIELSWGGANFPAGTAEGGFSPDIAIPAGDYKITFNSATLVYNFETIVEYNRISLVGKSGPAGDWPDGNNPTDESRDAFMTKDPNDINLWRLANVTLVDYDPNADGGIKFRVDAKWDINWGKPSASTDSGFPSGTAERPGKNIEPVAGTYNVAFRSDTGEYAFSEASSTYDLLSGDVIKIFPNPAKDFLNVEVNTDALKGQVKVTLYNVNGQELRTQVLNTQGTSKINVSDIQAGNYVLRISNDKNLVAKSVVIIK
ncbi:MAG TPA: SusF/SusE family outer membrane protein [Saprospiraceae bacterium]|nr:SusF/SusE family outer membrane protein [Saprospiraceae bacterium]